MEKSRWGRGNRLGTSPLVDTRYTYDNLGSLRSREDALRYSTESFGYDELNRVVWSEAIGGSRVYNHYDALGNLTCSRSTSPTDCAAGGGAVLEYDGTYGPHAVTSVSHVPSTGLNVNGESGPFEMTFQYDADGYQSNRLEADATPSRILVTNALGRVTFAWEQDVGSNSYVYGPDQELLWRHASDGTSSIDVFRPFDGYERWEVDGAIEHRITLTMPDGTLLLYDTPDQALPFDSSRASYVLTDPLGSPQVVVAAAEAEASSFDPFGRHVDPWSRELVARGPVAERVSDVSFTGQREEPGLNLYHYGARLYDPTIGRFLQPDTIIQSPYDAQNLNRYSYVRNDPLNLVDPTGNLLWTFQSQVTVHEPNGGVSFILPGEQYHVFGATYQGQDVFLFISPTGLPGAGGAAAIFLATILDRPDSAAWGNGIVTSSGEPTLVGEVSSEVRRNFFELVDGFIDIESQFAFLEAIAGVNDTYSGLADQYVNNSINEARGEGGQLCSGWCQLAQAEGDAAATAAELAAFESWWLANLRVSVGITLAIHGGFGQVGVRAGLEYGLVQGQLGLRPKWAPAWGGEANPKFRITGAVPVIVRWDPPDASNQYFSAGKGPGPSGAAIVSDGGLGGVGVVYGFPKGGGPNLSVASGATPVP